MSLARINDACGVLTKDIEIKEDEHMKPLMLIVLASHEFPDEDSHSDLPTCESIYPTRLGIVTGKADQYAVSSIVKNTQKLSHDEYHATALAKLTQCVQDSCCIEVVPQSPNNCARSSTLKKKTEKYSA